MIDKIILHYGKDPGERAKGKREEDMMNFYDHKNRREHCGSHYCNCDYCDDIFRFLPTLCRMRRRDYEKMEKGAFSWPSVCLTMTSSMTVCAAGETILKGVSIDKLGCVWHDQGRSTGGTGIL